MGVKLERAAQFGADLQHARGYVGAAGFERCDLGGELGVLLIEAAKFDLAFDGLVLDLRLAPTGGIDFAGDRRAVGKKAVGIAWFGKSELTGDATIAFRPLHALVPCHQLGADLAAQCGDAVAAVFKDRLLYSISLRVLAAPPLAQGRDPLVKPGDIRGEGRDALVEQYDLVPGKVCVQRLTAGS